MRLEKSL